VRYVSILNSNSLKLGVGVYPVDSVKDTVIKKCSEPEESSARDSAVFVEDTELDECERVMSQAFAAERALMAPTKMSYAKVLRVKAPRVQDKMTRLHKMASYEVVKRERVQPQVKEAEATGRLSYAKVLRVEYE
jgi:hypothetical protein